VDRTLSRGTPCCECVAGSREVGVRIVVTGGAGYVGSVTVEHLLAAGHEVVVVDDLSTGHRAAIADGACFVQGDLRDAATLEAVFASGADAVVHFAARSLVADSMRDPFGYWEHNLSTSLALLRAMRRADVPRCVFSSSAAVYGEPGSVPIPETANAAPRHAYGGSKHAIELVLADAGREFGLRSVALRYFNAAGASRAHGEDHRPESHLVPAVLQAARDGTPVLVHGDDWPTADGTCIRDYVHVEDLARAHVAALTALDHGLGGAVNLGTAHGHSVRQVIAAAQSVTGRPIAVRTGPRRAGDPPVLVADATLAARLLRWAPTATLEDIVASAWAWMRDHPHGYGDAE
jgi:UDP-glucose-4-epimerase GalE